jgi:hypothetical protein
MVPPQDNPTFQAVSSATPPSVFGLPDLDHVDGLATTAPSTQPPETELRVALIVNHQVSRPGAGADPQVSTTVASATPRPSRRQSSAALRISSSRDNIRASMSPLKYGSPQPARQRQGTHAQATLRSHA